LALGSVALWTIFGGLVRQATVVAPEASAETVQPDIIAA
jgi:hypothetical protein